jgi:hypothetical protein
VLGAALVVVLLAWAALPYLSELAPGLLARLHPWLHAYLFG